MFSEPLFLCKVKVIIHILSLFIEGIFEFEAGKKVKIRFYDPLYSCEDVCAMFLLGLEI